MQQTGLTFINHVASRMFGNKKRTGRRWHIVCLEKGLGTNFLWWPAQGRGGAARTWS